MTPGPTHEAGPAPDDAVDTVTVLVRLFGMQAQLAGAGCFELQLLPGHMSVADLRAALRRAAPALGPSLPSSRFAVNHAYAPEHLVLVGSEDVALIGLVGGG